jgi:hypothetical protein
MRLHDDGVMLDAGYWPAYGSATKVGCWILDTRYWIQDDRYEMLDTGCWFLVNAKKMESNNMSIFMVGTEFNEREAEVFFYYYSHPRSARYDQSVFN